MSKDVRRVSKNVRRCQRMSEDVKGRWRRVVLPFTNAVSRRPLEARKIPINQARNHDSAFIRRRVHSLHMLVGFPPVYIVCPSRYIWLSLLVLIGRYGFMFLGRPRPSSLWLLLIDFRLSERFPVYTSGFSIPCRPFVDSCNTNARSGVSRGTGLGFRGISVVRGHATG